MGCALLVADVVDPYAVAHLHRSHETYGRAPGMARETCAESVDLVRVWVCGVRDCGVGKPYLSDGACVQPERTAEP